MSKICAFELNHIRLLKWIQKGVKKEMGLPSFKRFWTNVYLPYLTNVGGVIIIKSPLKECLSESCYHYMILQDDIYFISSESCPIKAIASFDYP